MTNHSLGNSRYVAKKFVDLSYKPSTACIINQTSWYSSAKWDYLCQIKGINPVDSQNLWYWAQRQEIHFRDKSATLLAVRLEISCRIWELLQDLRAVAGFESCCRIWDLPQGLRAGGEDGSYWTFAFPSKSFEAGEDERIFRFQDLLDIWCIHAFSCCWWSRSRVTSSPFSTQPAIS